MPSSSATTHVLSPVVDVVVQLIAADHVIRGRGKPNRNRPGKTPFAKLEDDDLRRVAKEAQRILHRDPDSMLSYLYYGGCNMEGGCIAGMTLLSQPSLSSPERGCFNYSMRVSYALTGLVTPKELRKEIDGIFAHWKWSGDVTYRILSFSVHRHFGVYPNIAPEGHALYGAAARQSSHALSAIGTRCQ